MMVVRGGELTDAAWAAMSSVLPVNVGRATSTDDDVTAINADEARYEPETQSYIVSGRRYKMKDNGTMYPLDGPGLVNLSLEEFNALKTMVKHRGDLDQAWESIRRDSRMSRETFDSVRDRVFRHHKDYKGS